MSLKKESEAVFTCPECAFESAEPLDAEFGWCPECRRFTGALAVAKELTPEDRKSRCYSYFPGGLMRCCVESLAAWVTLHDGPWQRGRFIRCRHHDTTIMYNGEQWLWQSPSDDVQDEPRDTQHMPARLTLQGKKANDAHRGRNTGADD